MRQLITGDSTGLSTPSCGAAKEWDVLQLASHAQILSKQRHHDQAHQVDRPPAVGHGQGVCGQGGG